MVHYIQYSRCKDLAKNCNPYQHLVINENGKVSAKNPPPKKFCRSSLTPEMREENRKSWKIFNQMAEGVLGTRIKQFNNYDVDLKKMEVSGSPLLSKHVEMIGVIAANLFTKHIKKDKDEKLKNLSPQEIVRRIQDKNSIPFLGKAPPPESIYGSPTELKALFSYDAFLMDKERLHLFQNFYQTHNPHAFLERLAKATSNRELREKMIVPAPAGDGNIHYYKVYKKITTGHGLVGYALKPLSADSSLKPILVFRPSQFAPSAEDFLETWINDAQLKLGKWGYTSARQLLRDLMNDPKFCPKGTKIDVTGFSLAGAHTQRFLVDHALKISNAVFFNDPSIDHEAVIAFADRTNALPRLPEKIHLKLYRVKGDRADKIGFEHIGKYINHPDIDIELEEITPFPEDRLTPAYLHSKRFLDAPQKRYTSKVYKGPELGQQLSNKERGNDVFWYEITRRFWPIRMAYGFVCGIYAVGSFLGRKLRVHILRNSTRKREID